MCEAEFCCDEGQWLADQDQYEREKKANGDSLVRSMQKRIESQREELRRLNNHIRIVEQARNTWKGKAAMLGKQLHDVLTAKQPEWISVEERLPEIDPCGKGRYGGTRSVRVLCACKQRDGRTFVKEGYYEPCGNGRVCWRIPGSINAVTHWMPLPMPPKGDEGKMNKQLAEYVMAHGREKCGCTIIDKSGVKFRVGNVICDNKIYFVASANSKVIGCKEIEIDHPTEKGGAEE